MALTNMQVYNTEIQGNTIELIDQKISEITAATRGAIQLTSERFTGSYAQESFWQNLSAAQRRVDRFAANGAQAATSLAQSEVVGVKVAGGFGPVLLEPSQMAWLQRSPAEAITAIANYFADAVIQDQLNTGIASAAAAIANVAALTNDITPGTNAIVTQTEINNTHAKFGDMSQMLVCDVMSGKVYHQLVGQGLTNSSQLFKSDNVTIVDILGKAVLVSDVPALTVAGSPGTDKVVSLCSGGVMLSDNNDIVTNLDTTNGKERIETTWQADYSFNVKLKGYAWDITNGGASPTDAELATGTNWDKVALDKFTAGAILLADAS